MATMYESLVTGLMEILHDIQEYGEPKGRKTIIEYTPEKEGAAAETDGNHKETKASQTDPAENQKSLKTV